MRRALPIVWLAALALILTWRLRPPPRDRSTPVPPEKTEAAPEAALAAPAPVLVGSSRKRFSSPDGTADSRAVGTLEVVDTDAVATNGAGRLGTLSAVAPGGAVAGPSVPSHAPGSPGSASGAGGGSAAGEAAAPAAAGAAKAAQAAAAARAASAKTADARAAFDGVRPGATGGGANAGTAPSLSGSGGAVRAGDSSLLGALRTLGGGAASAGRAPGDVKGRASGDVSGPGAAPELSGGLSSAGAGAAPGPVAGAAVEGRPGEGEGEEKPPEIKTVQALAGEPQPEGARPSEIRFSSDRGRPAVLPTAQVRADGTKGPVVFEADMDIDADGAGGWHRADRTGQSQTALRYPNGDSLNPGTLPFMVVPVDFNRAHPDVRLGDYGVISYRGKSVYAIVGDKGPAGVLGEASISAAASLGINPDPNRGGVDSGVRYIILPGTADRTPPTDGQTLQTRGAQLFLQNGLPLR